MSRDRGNGSAPTFPRSAKYGKDELLRSILNPSAAIGYNFRSLVLALTDGRTITGLAVEDNPDRLVVKTADGQRITVRPGDIEDRKTSDVSLMPEGLAQTMSDQQLVDLLSLSVHLRKPVSIVGQYHVVGPLPECGRRACFRLRRQEGNDLYRLRRRAADHRISSARRQRGRPGRPDADIRRSRAERGLRLHSADFADRATGPPRGRDSLRHTGLVGGKRFITAVPTHLPSEPREVELTLPRGTTSLAYSPDGGSTARGPGRHW